MSESRAQSPAKLERPELLLTDPEEETHNLPGPTTRSKKKNTAVNKLEIDLTTLLKFIKPYDGDRETLNSFIVNCNNAYDLASDPHKEILFKYILCQLQGKAQTACSVKEFTNWLQLKDFLKTQFSDRKHYAHLINDLQYCKQQPNEPISQYALRIETCLSRLLTEVSISHGHKSREMIGRTATLEELALHQFQMGLIPRISNIIRCKTPKTLNEAINLAISEEKIQQYLYKQNPPVSRPTTMTKPTTFYRPRPNFTPRPFFNNGNNTHNNYSSTVCRYCKIPGHTIEQCRKRQYNNERYRVDQSPRKSQNVHFISDAPEELEGHDTTDESLTQAKN